MRYYPVFLDLKGRPCTVVGGGRVAERKVEALLRAGASVTVISPGFTKKIKKFADGGKDADGGVKTLADGGRVDLLGRRYKRGDLAGAFLAVSATGSKDVNRAVYEEALMLNILVNVVDDPGNCNFIVPSVVDRGGLIIAISTSGKSPYLAKTIREDLETLIGTEYETFVEILGAVRKKLLKSAINHDKKERVIKALVKSPMPRWIKGEKVMEINGFLRGLLGEGYILSKLGVKIKTAASKKT